VRESERKKERKKERNRQKEGTVRKRQKEILRENGEKRGRAKRKNGEREK
jgi:hypothetical protein